MLMNPFSMYVRVAGGGPRGVGQALAAALGARPPPLPLQALREDVPRPAPDTQTRSVLHTPCILTISTNMYTLSRSIRSYITCLT